MIRKDISNYKLTSSSLLKLKFIVHFLKSPKQSGIESTSTFWETFPTFCDTVSLLESTLIVAWTLNTSHSLPILKNAYHPLIFISGRLQYCSHYAKFFFLNCFRQAKQYVNHFKFLTLLEYKFDATWNYWITKNKSSQIQWMATEYNKSHIQGILKKNVKNTRLHNFVLFL